MITQIHKGVGEGYNNKGSVQTLVMYLEKENEELHLEDQEYFFSHHEDVVTANQVIDIIDGHSKGLEKKDSKYFMLTSNPSQSELLHIQNDPEKMKDYVRGVMEDYAKNFNRELNGKPLDASDLVYFAKVERNRLYQYEDKHFQEAYKHNRPIEALKKALKVDYGMGKTSKEDLDAKLAELTEKQVLNNNGGVILPGYEKPGYNTHVHIIIHRYDKSKSMKLSPNSNSKGHQQGLNGSDVKYGFDRKAFYQNAQDRFDMQFGYKRGLDERFEHLNRMKLLRKGIGNARLLNYAIKDPRNLAQAAVQQAIQQNKLGGIINRIPKNNVQVRNKVISSAVDLIASALPADPLTKISLTLVKESIKQSVNALGYGTGMNI